MGGGRKERLKLNPLPARETRGREQIVGDI